MECIQINLHKGIGGGEVFTAFLCRALCELGVRVRLFAHPESPAWKMLDMPKELVIEPVRSEAEIIDRLPTERSWILGHGAMPHQILQALPGRHFYTAIAHMPVQGRNPRVFTGHDLVIGVSEWVLEGLRAANIPTWHEPLFGVANLDRPFTGDEIRRASRYSWDLRKFRERVLSWVEPAYQAIAPHPLIERRPGLTLGIVSQITPIKQFPLLFSMLSPIIARHPDINFEVIGAGAYTSIRDLRDSLAPLGDRVRFWGFQPNVAAVYRKLDVLLSGLPEKEALGLNIIEAQACGVPVLAVDAKPFTETVADGVTGVLYTDPRQDGGASFDAALTRIRQPGGLPDLKTAAAREHLEKFGYPAFRERIARLIASPQLNTIRS